MQAISGAGYPGVPSWDILGNVLPFISGEEEKIESETQKILGALDQNSFRQASYTVSAQANRVPVEEGHLECVSVKLVKKASVDDLLECWKQFVGPAQELKLPTAPERPVIVLAEDNRPQPRLDVMKNEGMSAFIGTSSTLSRTRLQVCGAGTQYHPGAAGASILNAELAAKRGMLD